MKTDIKKKLIIIDNKVVDRECNTYFLAEDIARILKIDWPRFGTLAREVRKCSSIRTANGKGTHNIYLFKHLIMFGVANLLFNARFISKDLSKIISKINNNEDCILEIIDNKYLKTTINVAELKKDLKIKVCNDNK